MKIKYLGRRADTPMTVVRDNQMTPNDPFNSEKSKKVLTIRKHKRIIEGVNKLKRKDNKMPVNKTNKVNAQEAIKSFMWLVEAAFRAFTGWILLTNFDKWVTTAVAFYALGTAGLIVLIHFFKAHK